MAQVSRISVVLSGLDDDRGDLRFTDFIAQLGNIQRALVETDRLVSGSRTVYGLVAGLSHRSPATIELEILDLSPETRNGPRVASALYNGFHVVQTERRAPPEYDYRALEALKVVALPLGKAIGGISVALDGQSTVLSPDFARTIDEIVGPDEYERGSVTGWLEKINLHAGQNVFTVYPATDQPGVRCLFKKSLREAAVRAVDRYVTVYGRLSFKSEADYPHAVAVREIEIHPPKSELPRLSDLLGVAPGRLKDESSEDFVRRLRDEWA